MRHTILLALFAGGCGWGNLPNQFQAEVQGPLWDPDGAVAATDGLYIRTPHNGGVVRIAADGEVTRVDILGGRVIRLLPAKQGEAVLATIERYRCDDLVTKPAPKTVDDCATDDLVVTTEMAFLEDGELGEGLPSPSAFNALIFTPDGSQAVTWVNPALGNLPQGILDLTSITLTSLADGTAQAVQVGFVPQRILFTTNTQGIADRALVLSDRELAVVDLQTSPPAVDVTFQLTLDNGQTVSASSIGVTPDGGTALVPPRNGADLYALDLFEKEVNIIELGGSTRDMVVHGPSDHTVLVMTGQSVTVLDHERFETEKYGLDEPMTTGISLPTGVMLWSNQGYRDVYLVEPVSGDVTELRLETPAWSMTPSPSGRFVAATTSASDYGEDTGYQNRGGRGGLEIIDFAAGQIRPYVLEGVASDAVWSETADRSWLLVAQQNRPELVRYDAITGLFETIALDRPATAIRTLGDGNYAILHDDELGRVSFLAPDGSEVVVAAAFGLLGLQDKIPLQIEKD